MDNGVIILSAIVLLFVGMYVYAYSFEYFERIRKARQLKMRQQAEAQYQEHKAVVEKEIKQKFKKIETRSQEIQKELQRLSEFRNEISEKYNNKNAQIDVNTA
ncbi:hypothetical protein NA63_1504 [Flavobacteriaceae bacterium MAR_2010_105]|nr:hypothetical protein NA63_1504 [Flavobacteriaceae bacterium MAR_2010_105]